MEWGEDLVRYSCLGKQKFESRLLAERIAKRSNRRLKGKGGRKVYRCFNHDTVTWHIGSNALRRDRLILK